MWYNIYISEVKKNNKKYMNQAINDYVIVKIARKTESKIVLPEIDKLSSLKLDVTFIAESVGDQVTKVKAGDCLILAGFTLGNPNAYLEHVKKDSGDESVRLVVKESDIIGVVKAAKVK